MALNMALASSLTRVGHWVLDYALPPRCAGCGLIVEGDDRFCQSCWSALHFLTEPCCSTCGVPFDIDLGEGACCPSCLADPPPWKSARAALRYDDVARSIAHRLKYSRRTGLARLMAGLMASRIAPQLQQAEDAEDKGQWLILPVPLHRWRLWGRGFNQSLVIARHLAQTLCLPVDAFALKRVKATRPLYELSHKERKKILSGAFAIDPEHAHIIKGKTILLIDDIYTSGATARACTEVLMKAGAHAVHLLCWARVLGDETLAGLHND